MHRVSETNTDANSGAHAKPNTNADSNADSNANGNADGNADSTADGTVATANRTCRAHSNPHGTTKSESYAANLGAHATTNHAAIRVAHIFADFGAYTKTDSRAS